MTSQRKNPLPPGASRLLRFRGGALALAALALVLLLAGGAGHAAAQQTPVRVLEASAVSRLPDGIEFNATVAGDVEEVSVRFSIRGRRATQYDYLQFDGEARLFTTETPGRATLFYRTDTRARYMPPGIVMEYRVEALGSDGSVHESEPRELVLTDSRFEWETVTRDGVTVYYHGPVSRRAESLLDASLVTIQNMAPVLGIPLEGAPINVTMYNNIAEMIDATAARSGAISRELITEGQAFSEENAVIALGGSARATGTMSHELTHVLLSRAVTGARAAMPTWLNEGLAEFGNIDPGVSYQRYLEWGVDTNRIAPLSSLGAFPGDPDLVIVSYGQSRDVVRFMIDTFGPDAMAQLLAEFNRTRNLNDALVATYGLDIRALDDLWRRSVGASPLSQVEQAAPTPTPPALPTFQPYTLDNIGAAPTPTAEAAAPDRGDTPAVEPSPAPAATAEPSHEPSGGGCFAAGPNAPIEGGSALILLAAGSAAAFRGARLIRPG